MSKKITTLFVAAFLAMMFVGTMAASADNVTVAAANYPIYLDNIYNPYYTHYPTSYYYNIALQRQYPIYNYLLASDGSDLYVFPTDYQDTSFGPEIGAVGTVDGLNLPDPSLKTNDPRYLILGAQPL